MSDQTRWRARWADGEIVYDPCEAGAMTKREALSELEAQETAAADWCEERARVCHSNARLAQAAAYSLDEEE